MKSYVGQLGAEVLNSQLRERRQMSLSVTLASSLLLSVDPRGLGTIPVPGFFYFLAFFLKFFHKYAPGGKISKSRPLARRHSCWHRAYTAWRQRCWR